MKKQCVIIAISLANLCYFVANSNANEIAQLEEGSKEGNEWYLNFNSTGLLPSDYNTETNYASFSNDTDYNFSASLSYNSHLTGKLFQNTRLETEVFFSNSGLKDNGIEGKISRSSIMENAFYDFDTGTSVQPYLGTGIGVANVSIENTTATNSKADESFTLPAYQAMAGVTYQSETYPSAKANMGYKYFATIGRQTINNIEPTLKNANTHSIEAGIKVGF